MREPVRRAVEACPLELAVAILGGTWKLTIVKHLLDGPLRTGHLQRLMSLAPERTLTRQLRELEQDGIVNRTVYPEVPPHVEYTLTPLGETLEALVTGMNAWGKNYLSTTPQDGVEVDSRS